MFNFLLAPYLLGDILDLGRPSFRLSYILFQFNVLRANSLNLTKFCICIDIDKIYAKTKF